MKSILVEGPGQLKLVERPVPNPEQGEVRVRVGHAGICGSDIHIYHGTHPFVRYPRVIGHEFAGTIDAVGPGVDAARIGQRVAVTPVISCGECYQCRVGRPNVCANLQVVGVHRDGGFSEYCCVAADLAHAVPDTVDDRASATVEPFSIAANMLSRTGVEPFEVALVYGAGPIGMTVIQALKGVYQVETLIVAERIEARLDWARAAGADLAINTSDRKLSDVLAERGLAPTLIIDAACHPTILEEAIDLAAPAARIGLMGFSPDPSHVSQRKLNAKELSIFASRLNNRQFPNVIDWMARGQIKPAQFISHSFPFTNVHDAFALLETAPADCCKVMLDFA
ncbi:Zn-dependent oxidoreductase [Microvirga sp. P5_D2]